jgi:hypothetical protein
MGEKERDLRKRNRPRPGNWHAEPAVAKARPTSRVPWLRSGMSPLKSAICQALIPPRKPSPLIRPLWEPSERAQGIH